jgi:carbonic anhydrase
MDKLIKGLRHFQSSYFCEHQDLFEQLSHGQKPRVLFIACSDSRVDPNLITESEPGELFVIRNAGNIVPPYGAANGGEGAAIEYAIHALDVEQVIVCGHSHCGAMKGLLKIDSLRNTMPLVSDWLVHAEATRRLIQENYGDRTGEELLDLTVAENVLTQIENLRTYPVVHSRLSRNKITLHGWVYHIETGVVMAYDPELHAYVPVNNSAPACPITTPAITASSSTSSKPVSLPNTAPPNAKPAATAANGSSWLTPDQHNRIYRGSYSRSS